MSFYSDTKINSTPVDVDTNITLDPKTEIPDPKTEIPTTGTLRLIDQLFARGIDTLTEFGDITLSELEERLDAVVDSSDSSRMDPFGMDPRELRRTAVIAAFFYKVYFRCETKGVEQIPKGPAILAANHAGQIPIDAVQIIMALLLEGEHPRLARSMMDRWVTQLPFLSSFYARVGVALGSPENAKRLLKRDEILLTFPEGIRGISKTIDKAYNLQPFGPGFVRLALSTNTPIVPVAVVGSEEQYPTLYNLKGIGKHLGLPALPIWLQMVIPGLGLLPLPVKYHIQFGQPIYFEGDPDDNDSRILEMADVVKQYISQMVTKLRKQRKNLFF